ncbi:hypothetical protein D3C75_1230550 [compost metagenome]
MQGPPHHLGRNHIALQKLADPVDQKHIQDHFPRNGGGHQHPRRGAQIWPQIRNDIEHRHHTSQQQRIFHPDEPIADVSHHPDNDADQELPPDVAAQGFIDFE